MEKSTKTVSQLEELATELKDDRAISEFLTAAVANAGPDALADAQFVATRARSYNAISELQAQAQELGLYQFDRTPESRR